MNNNQNRVVSYLLSRLRRSARHEIFGRAAEAGLLNQKMLGKSSRYGLIWELPEDHVELFTGDIDYDRKLIQELLKVSNRYSTYLNNDDDLDDEFESQFKSPKNIINENEHLQNKIDHAKNTNPRKQNNQTLTVAELNARRKHVLSIVASFAPSLKTNEVVTSLLIAKAFARDEKNLHRFIAIMKYEAPIIALKVPVHDFERQLGQMLENGLIMPFYISLSSIKHGPTLTGSHHTLADSKRRKSIECLSSIASKDMDDKELRQVIAKDILHALKPLIIADDSDLPLPKRLVLISDLMIEGDKIDTNLIADTLAICCKIPIERSVFLMNEMNFAPSNLGIDDLAIAIRSGRSLTKIISILMSLETENILNKDDQDNDQNYSPFGNSKKGSRSHLARNRNKYSSCFDVIEPSQSTALSEVVAKLEEQQCKGDKNHLLIEQLAGYGEARSWALDLKQDLEMWKDDKVKWSDLSSRLLLSGPPGTGKTTYANALCNSLQIPLIATSVSRWLESSDLGKVLSTITATFEYVSKNSPCILFIDEIDNIGNRTGDGGNADYWSSLINRLLELLDGAAKTDGVIVVAATNQPEKIDRALLRSGRLEKHVVIPAPCTDALIGIIAYHLGDDLNSVLKSYLSKDPIEASMGTKATVFPNYDGAQLLRNNSPFDNINTGEQSNG